MSEPDARLARSTLADATHVQDRTRRAGRWFARYMVVLAAAAFALILAIETLYPSGVARLAAATAWAAIILVAGRWARAHEVYPANGGRRILIAGLVWFGSYLFLLGPLVRWKAGDSAAWWALASAVLASPFLFGAWRAWRHP